MAKKNAVNWTDVENEATIDWYYDALGCPLLRAKRGDKTPITKDWVNSSLSSANVKKHDGNLGCVLQDHVLVVDVDLKNDNGEAAINQLRADTGEPIEPMVMTPSGGFHAYYHLPTEMVGKLSKWSPPKGHPYHGIDFLTTGAQAIIPGSVTAVGSYDWVDGVPDAVLDAPEELLSAIIQGRGVRKGGSELAVRSEQAREQLTSDDIERMLKAIKPPEDYNYWTNIGMAIHDWDDGDEGFRLWDDWSRSCAALYDDPKTDTAAKWASFTRDKEGGVRIGTLNHHYREATGVDVLLALDFPHLENPADPKEIMVGVRQRIEDSTTEEELQDALKLAGAVDWAGNDVRLRQAATAYKKKAALFNADVTMAQATKSISAGGGGVKKKKAQQSPTKAVNVPEFDKWVFLEDDNLFLNIETRKARQKESFNRNTPLRLSIPEKTETGRYIAPTEYADQNPGLLKQVSTLMYRPDMPPGIITIAGEKFYNSFRHELVAVPDTGYTKAGKDAIDRFNAHIDYMTARESSPDRAASLLKMWVAHNLQRPGVKLCTAVLIIGHPGSGKSYLSYLLSELLGAVNVSEVTNEDLESNFSAWKNGRCVNSLEEIKFSGENRFRIMEKLKTAISNKTTSYTAKGKDAQQIQNVTNYIAFSNHGDALPMVKGDGERRWFVVRCPPLLANHDDITSQLFDDVTRHKGQLCKYLMEYTIPSAYKKDWFTMQHKKAPMTTTKERMYEREEMKVEGLVEARDALMANKYGFNDSCISRKHLFGYLANRDHDPVILSSSQEMKVLDRLGFESCGAPVRIPSINGGKPQRGIFIPKGVEMRPQEIIEALKVKDNAGKDGTAKVVKMAPRTVEEELDELFDDKSNAV